MDKKKSSVILVVCHKPSAVYDKGIYMPIQVGKAITKIDLGYIGDDTGDNISNKNNLYSELTAQYWAWKNLDCKNIGLCHYRRYFKENFTEDRVSDILSKYDIILPKPIVEGPRTSGLLGKALGHGNEVFALFLMAIKNKAPEYSKDTLDYLNGNIDVPYNMFVMSKQRFDHFCKWQFNILFESERFLNLAGYGDIQRIYGYFSENLLAIYCKYHNLKIYYEPIKGQLDGVGYKPYYRNKISTFLYQMVHLNQPKTLDQMIHKIINKEQYNRLITVVNSINKYGSY